MGIRQVGRVRFSGFHAEVIGALEPFLYSFLERTEQEASQVAPNEKALTALREVAKRQEGRRHTDGSQTERILREGRAGAMYGSDPTE